MARDEIDTRQRCFMDGIAWEHELEGDIDGTLLFPSERSLRAVMQEAMAKPSLCIVDGKPVEDEIGMELSNNLTQALHPIVKARP